MTNIQFSEDELVLLSEILENNLTVLGVEIHRTDSADFKQKLTQRYQLMQTLLGKASAGITVTV